MARTNTGFFCKGACHKHGSMMSYEDHHIWPKEWHGPSTPDNMARICPNAHSNTHLLLGWLVRGKIHYPPVSPLDEAALKSYSPTERNLAVNGWRAIQAYAASIAMSKGFL